LNCTETAPNQDALLPTKRPAAVAEADDGCHNNDDNDDTFLSNSGSRASLTCKLPGICY